MVPNRDTLIVTGSEDEAGLAVMCKVGEDSFQKPRPISTVALRLVDDQWEPWLPDASSASHTKLRELKLRSLGIDTPDGIQIQARFRHGAVATFESAWIYPNTFPTMVDSYVTLICDDGVLQLDRQQENIMMATADGVAFPRNMLQRTVHGVHAGAYRDAIAHFVDCAVRGVEPLITVESSRHVTAVLEAAHASVTSGEPVAVAGPVVG
jgi:predicted dehydrogenase